MATVEFSLKSRYGHRVSGALIQIMNLPMPGGHATQSSCCREVTCWRGCDLLGRLWPVGEVVTC